MKMKPYKIYFKSPYPPMSKFYIHQSVGLNLKLKVTLPVLKKKVFQTVKEDNDIFPNGLKRIILLTMNMKNIKLIKPKFLKLTAILKQT
jgi:hypothetical protein